MRLLGKVFIDGKLRTVTGLHIGSSKTDAGIGDIENAVLKDSAGVPYIPGSSLKGKIRSLLEKQAGKGEVCRCAAKSCNICVIFGTAAKQSNGDASAEQSGEGIGPTRLIVRDAFLSEDTCRKMKRQEGDFKQLEMEYTDSKWENVIDRLTSHARHPRQNERVPPGAEFDFQMIFNLMATDDSQRLGVLLRGLALLEDDYLGGNGSRGYGRVKFKDLGIKIKTITDYMTDNQQQLLMEGSFEQICEAKDELIAKIEEKLKEFKDEGL